MSRTRPFLSRALLAAVIAGPALGCQGETKSLSAPQCTAEMPCGSPSGGTLGTASGGAGQGGASNGGTGGTGAVAPVDATGSIVQFSTVAFDPKDVQPYLGAITVIAPGAKTATVEADAAGGKFELADAAEGDHWILAQNSDSASGGPYSTFSFQRLDGTTPLVLPVTPFDLLSAAATQMGVPSLTAGRAHMLLRIVDKLGQPLEGVSVTPLGAATIGYDIGPGQYATNTGATGSLGYVIVLNIEAAAQQSLNVGLQYNASPFSSLIQIAPDTVTYAPIAAP